MFPLYTESSVVSHSSFHPMRANNKGAILLPQLENRFTDPIKRQSMILEMQEGVSMSVLGWPNSPAGRLCVDFEQRPAFALPGCSSPLSGVAASLPFSLVNHD